MSKRFAFALLLLVVAPAFVAAQTVNRVLAWDHLADTLTHVNGYVFTLKIDAAAAAAMTPTCQTAGANVHCTTPVTLTSGTHTLVITATNDGGTANGTLNYTPSPPPTTPTSITITIQITVP